MQVLKNQKCAMCGRASATLTESTEDVPHFGKCFLMSMTCSSCHYHQSDVESEESDHNPVKHTFEIKSKKDLNVRVIKAAQATVKIPQMRLSITPGVASIGYISNIEGLLARFKAIIEEQRDNAEDAKVRKAAKRLLKKLWNVENGDQPMKIVIEDPSGNSAIVSDETKTEKLKVK